MIESCKSVNDLYEYFDNLFDDGDEDTLFASSYIRGFLSLAAAEYGDDEQPLTSTLAADIAQKLKESKSELSPQDQHIVQTFWQDIQAIFTV